MVKPKTPLLTVDAVVFDSEGCLLMVRRKNPRFKGGYALPGGFVDVGGTVEAACRRELFEETGLVAARLDLIGVYSDPDRDPRGHTCSIAFLAKVRKYAATAGDGAFAVDWISHWRKVPVAFDHRTIVADAFSVMQAKR